MKRFLRNLTLIEREGLASSICYFSFLTFHLISIKYLIIMREIGYLTILSNIGIVIALIWTYRLFMSLKKINQNNILLINLMSNGGIFAFLTFAGTILSLYWISINNLILIFRLYPFLIFINEYISNGYQIPQYIIYSFILNIASILFILIPTLNEQGPGIFIGLLSIFFKVISTKYWKGKDSNGIKIDVMMLSIALYSVGIGYYIILTLNYNVEYLGKFGWFLTILNGFTIYYTRIFIIQVINKIINIDKIIIINGVCLINLYFIDIFFFNKTFHIVDLTLLIIMLDSLYYIYRLYKKKSEMDKSLNNLLE